MNNIFTEMRVPELGEPTFQTDFTAFCEAMKQNIERLMSVQYTKGEPGNSVYASKAHVGYSATGKLTNISAGILGTIFDTEFNTSMDLQAVNNVIAGEEANIMVDNDYFTNGGVAPSIVVDGIEYKAIPSLMNDLNGFDIEVNVDDVTGVAYLANPYIFIDNRIAGLNRMVRSHAKDEEIYKTFHDFSVAIYGKGVCDVISHPEQDPNDPATWEWEFEAVQMVPKLYFDDVINEFCWDINGQQTGVTAQGIKGDDGVSPNMIIAIGTKTGSIITFEKVQVINEEGDIQWATKNEDGVWGYFNTSSEYVIIEQPKVGDFVLVFYPAAGHINGDYFECAYVGKTYIGSTGAYTYIGFDEDGRCDIFESIKLHDHWGLMMDINAYTTGTPRGYLLPAEPGQSSTYPSTKPDKVHMTYSEKTNQDSAGFGKLHSSPILRGGNPDPTQMSQTNNPPADHIGDWQVDYNMDVKGNMAVQGNSTVQGNMAVQGNTTVQGTLITRNNTTVQGNLEVQGKILGTDFQVTGKPFPISIRNPYLACVSRFKDVSYFVDRELPRELTTSGGKSTYLWKDIKYTLNLTAKLEVTIGMISSMFDTDMDAAHRALQGYVDDTWGQQNGAQGVQNNKNYCHNFNSYQSGLYSNSNLNSKLYNAIKYVIPINLVKTVTIPVYGRSQSIQGLFGTSLFDFTGIVENGTPSDTSSAITPNINSSHIQVGCNTTSELDFSKISYRGYVRTFAYDTNYGNFRISNDVDVDGSVEGIFSTINYIDQTKTPNLKYGAVQGVVSKLDNSSTDSSLKNKYAVNGKLYYPPMDIDINYYIDMFVRVFEYFALTKTNTTPQTLDKTYNYITFGATPVGCMLYADGNTNKKYMAAIWNGLNTDNYVPQKLSSIKSINSGGNGMKFVWPSATSVCLSGKHELNPLISGNFTDNNEYLGIATGTIIYGTDISTDNIISVFNTPNTGGNVDLVSVQGVKVNEISTNYFDLTPRMRIVENNVKVCPNNVNDGAWQMDNNSKIFWFSAVDVPMVVFPYEGKVGVWNASSNKGAVKLGVGNLRYGGESNIGAMSLWGMLIYPYTPAVISLDDNGDTNANKDKCEDATLAAGYTQGTIFVNTGRMMGISDGNVCGANYGIISNGDVTPVNPDDHDIPVSQDIEPEDESYDIDPDGK